MINVNVAMETYQPVFVKKYHLSLKPPSEQQNNSFILFN